MTAIPRKTKKIGIFALANAPAPEDLGKGVKNFEEYTGMEVLPYSVKSPGPRHFAGGDAQRAKEFNDLLGNPEVSGLVAIRGGYGVTRVLEQIDFEALRQKDCFLCGYSDITALLLVAWKYGCRKFIHGPMIQSGWNADSSSPAFQIEAESFLRVQGTGDRGQGMGNGAKEQLAYESVERYKVQGMGNGAKEQLAYQSAGRFRGQRMGNGAKEYFDNLKESNKQLGEATLTTQITPPLSTCTLYPVPCTLPSTLLSKPSFLKSACPLSPVPCPLIPMNLTLLCALLGTPFLPDLTGTILALEDISEPAHDIDRKLNQLRQAGILQRLAGLIFGQFTNAEDAEFIPEIRREYAEFVSGPVIENFPFGHCHPSIALPFGMRARIAISPDNIPNLTWNPN